MTLSSISPKPAFCVNPLVKNTANNNFVIQNLPTLQNPPNPKPLLLYSPKPHNKNKNKNKKHTATATPTDILRLMDALQLPVPQDVYAYLLKECTDFKDAETGAHLHSHMNRRGYKPTLLLANRLLAMYARCGRLDSARQLFDKMLLKDSISWLTIIAAHVDSGHYLEALFMFKHMMQQGYQMFDESIWSLLLNCVVHACIETGDTGVGKQVHGLVLKMNPKISSNGNFITSFFISFYGKLGCVTSARRVFDSVKVRDTVIWTAMIVVYGREEQFREAFEVFKEMGRAGTRKNNFTLSSVIRACGRMGDEVSGRQVHCNAIKLGVELDQFVRCSLVDMYGKCGMVKDAQMVFERKEFVRNKIEENDACWNAMLTAYTKNGFCNEAVKFLYQMKDAGVQLPESLLNQVRIDCGN